MNFYKSVSKINRILICLLIFFGCVSCASLDKNLEEKVATTDSSVVAEKDVSDGGGEKTSDDQLNEPIREIEPIANNPYFFEDIEKEYIYSVKLFFSEDIKEVPVKVAYIKSFENGDVYSLSIQHEDCTERYYYDVLDRFDIGTFYVTNDSIYLLLQCEDIPDEETFISEGMLVCSETDIDENNDGLHQKIENNGDNCCFSYDNTLIESGFYSTYKWTKEKGLTYFRSGYGAEGSPIEIMLDE
ncbi:MAG: hypothetical protein J5802_02880 [Butyrivibrio sp.]|nr:hypothetical protein [Butyrivibrio sp.]